MSLFRQMTSMGAVAKVGSLTLRPYGLARLTAVTE